MKYLLLIGLVLVLLWAWRKPRLGAGGERVQRPPVAMDIVECRHCTLHLPRADAVQGQRGPYCSEAHRREAEGG